MKAIHKLLSSLIGLILIFGYQNSIAFAATDLLRGILPNTINASDPITYLNDKSGATDGDDSTFLETTRSTTSYTLGFELPSVSTLKKIRIKVENITSLYTSVPVRLVDANRKVLKVIKPTTNDYTEIVDVANVKYVWVSGKGNGVHLKLYSIEAYSNLEEPLILSGTTDNHINILSWKEINGATSYNVKRSLTPGGPYETIAAKLNDIIFEDVNVENGITYYYVVTANTENGESVNSNEVTLTPDVIVTPEPEPEPEPEPTPAPDPQPTGDRALLVINLVSGAQKEFDLSAREIADFLDWYEDRAEGKGNEAYMLNKQYNIGPFTSRHDYVVFRMIESFEVKEYKQ